MYMEHCDPLAQGVVPPAILVLLVLPSVSCHLALAPHCGVNDAETVAPET